MGGAELATGLAPQPAVKAVQPAVQPARKSSFSGLLSSMCARSRIFISRILLVVEREGFLFGVIYSGVILSYFFRLSNVSAPFIRASRWGSNKDALFSVQFS